MKTLQHSQEFIKEIHWKSYSDIAKQIRKDLKTVFEKTFKFSVKTQTYAGGGSINVVILAGNIEFYTKEYQELKKISTETGTCEARENLMREYSDRYTEEGKKVMDEVERIYNQYNHNNSDSMTDYFDVNYYGQVEIWAWDRPYTITA